jgi:hydroxypyruvate reductase
MTAPGNSTGDEREMRATAREIFQHALDESGIERGFARNLHYERGVLQVGEDLYDLSTFSKLFVVSFGKGAHSSLEALISRLGAGTGVSGIVCAPTLPAAQVFGFRYFEGGHPMPNHESLRAAEAILRALDSLNGRSLVIYLLSGGGSAIVEKPISDEITFDDLVQTYRALVHSGAPIALINAVRKHLSAVKGGRMAVAASPATQLSIMISDDAGQQHHPSVLRDRGKVQPDAEAAGECVQAVPGARAGRDSEGGRSAV